LDFLGPRGQLFGTGATVAKTRAIYNRRNTYIVPSAVVSRGIIYKRADGRHRSPRTDKRRNNTDNNDDNDDNRTENGSAPGVRFE